MDADLPLERHQENKNGIDRIEKQYPPEKPWCMHLLHKLVAKKIHRHQHEKRQKPLFAKRDIIVGYLPYFFRP